MNPGALPVGSTYKRGHSQEGSHLFQKNFLRKENFPATMRYSGNETL